MPTSLGFRVANFRFFLWGNGTAAPGLVMPTSLGFRVANFQKKITKDHGTRYCRTKLVQFEGFNFSFKSKDIIVSGLPRSIATSLKHVVSSFQHFSLKLWSRDRSRVRLVPNQRPQIPSGIHDQN